MHSKCTLFYCGLEHFLFSHILGIVTPTDELIFFRGVGIPPTSLLSSFFINQFLHCRVANYPMLISRSCDVPMPHGSLPRRTWDGLGPKIPPEILDVDRHPNPTGRASGPLRRSSKRSAPGVVARLCYPLSNMGLWANDDQSRDFGVPNFWDDPTLMIYRIYRRLDP